MSAARDRARAAGFINGHDVADFATKHGGRGIYLAYRCADNGRMSVSAAWQVRLGYKTDHWTDQGCKTFNTFQFDHSRPATERAARDWCADRYGIAEWAKIPGLTGYLFPAEDAKLVIAAIKAHK